ELGDVILLGAEIGEHDVAGVVARIDEVGRARAAGRRGAMAVDGDRNGHDRAGLDVAQLRPRATVDRAARQVKKEVDDARAILAAGDAAQELVDLPADARQDRRRGEQGTEKRWPHAFSQRAETT